MRRREYYGCYGRRPYRHPRRYDHEPGRRSPFRVALIVLLALAALVVLASLT